MLRLELIWFVADYFALGQLPVSGVALGSGLRFVDHFSNWITLQLNLIFIVEWALKNVAV
jgi:hypothetical protein